MQQIEINGIWWDCENTRINGEKFADFDTANAYAKKICRRLPTKEELQALIDRGYEWDEKKQGMWFADRQLFLPTEGWKVNHLGKIYSGGGFYWSSSAFRTSYSWRLHFDRFIAGLGYSYYALGLSVRYVADRKDNW